MAKKTTKKATKGAKFCSQIDPDRYKNMLIVALIAMIVGITIAFTAALTGLKNELDAATTPCETVED